jgi:hypothetical protein
VTRSRRRLAYVVGLLAALVGGTPAARAASAEVGTSMEAWYARVPSVEARPPDTLHVGVLLGVEESRTYLALDLAGVDAARVTGGTLRLPVDLASSRSPELGAIDVCSVGSPGPAVMGSTDDPPAVDCSVTAPAKFDAAAGALLADLAPFASALATTGLALVPHAPAPGPTTWHVALWGAANRSAGARPIRATLRLVDVPETDAPKPTPPSTPTGTFGGEGTAFAAVESPSTGQLFAPAPLEAAPPAPSLGVPDTAVFPRRGTPSAASPVAARSATDTRPPNSVAFALPLVLLALAGYVGAVLTRPALPAGLGPAPAAPRATPPRDDDAPGPSTGD